MFELSPTADILDITDVQNDFCRGGSLAVPDADAVVPVINRLARKFASCFMTQDWHPAGHASFRSSHPDATGPTVRLPYGEQVLWPDHCIQNSRGAEFHKDLDVPNAAVIIRKGMNPQVDSYSGFFENDRRTPTGLDGWLRGRGIRRIFLCGLATDFCVAYSAFDAIALGYEVVLIGDACRGVGIPNPDGSTTIDAALAQFRDKGVVITDSSHLIASASQRLG